MICPCKNNIVIKKSICESKFHFKTKPQHFRNSLIQNNLTNKSLNIMDNIMKNPVLHYVQKYDDSLNYKKAGCIIFDIDLKHIVVVKNRMSFEKGEDKYGLPKGQIKPDESAIHAAERELYEETGIRLKINSQSNVIQILDTLYFILFLNKKKFETFIPIDNLEIIATEWVDVNKIKFLTLNRSLFKIVQIWDNIFNK